MNHFSQTFVNLNIIAWLYSKLIIGNLKWVFENFWKVFSENNNNYYVLIKKSLKK